MAASRGGMAADAARAAQRPLGFDGWAAAYLGVTNAVPLESKNERAAADAILQDETAKLNLLQSVPEGTTNRSASPLRCLQDSANPGILASIGVARRTAVRPISVTPPAPMRSRSTQ